MSSAVGEKRRTSARTRREPPHKKRHITPEEPVKAEPSPEPEPERPQTPLPVRLADGKPLPTVKEPQEDLGPEFQTIGSR